jgi:hypothetical protein
MARCDLCSTPGMGTIVKAEDMSAAVRKGFNPFKEGITPDRLKTLDLGSLYDHWRVEAISGDLSRSDWNVCDKCMTKLKPYLGGSSSSMKYILVILVAVGMAFGSYAVSVKFWSFYGSPEKGKLFLQTDPDNAKIRLVNVNKEFHPGIELSPGTYFVEVSSLGHQSKTVEIKLNSKETKTVKIGLPKNLNFDKKQMQFEISKDENNRKAHKTEIQNKTALGSLQSTDQQREEKQSVSASNLKQIIGNDRLSLDWKIAPDRNMNWHQTNSTLSLSI